MNSFGRLVSADTMKGRGKEDSGVDERASYNYKEHSFSKAVLQHMKQTNIKDQIGPEHQEFLSLVVKKFAC